MINPDTLKRGDLVIFGGVLERKVSHVSRTSILFEDSDIPVSFSEPWWEIAELKKPELPETLYFQGVPFGSGWQDGYLYSPKSALDDARMIVMQLESAGVK